MLRGSLMCLAYFMRYFPWVYVQPDTGTTKRPVDWCRNWISVLYWHDTWINTPLPVQSSRVCLCFCWQSQTICVQCRLEYTPPSPPVSPDTPGHLENTYMSENFHFTTFRNDFCQLHPTPFISGSEYEIARALPFYDMTNRFLAFLFYSFHKWVIVWDSQRTSILRHTESISGNYIVQLS